MLHDPALIDGLALELHIANVQRDRLPRRRLAHTDILARRLPRLACPVHAIYGVHDAIYRQYIHALAGEFARRPPHFPGLRAIGMMSGTSLDGVDVALIETDGKRIAGFGPSGYRPYAESERAVLRRALEEGWHAGPTPAAGREGRETVVPAAPSRPARVVLAISGSGAQQASARSYLICSD